MPKCKNTIRRYMFRMCQFWKRTILRLTINKLIYIILATVIIYILIVLFNEEPEITELENNSNEDENITREYIKHTKHPPIIWWNPGYRVFDETIECPNNLKCDVFDHRNKLRPNTKGAYIFYASRLNFNDLPLPRDPANVIWGLSHEESPRNVQELLHEPGLNLFNYSSTFSRHSNVPFPLQYMESLEFITSKNHYVTTSKKNKMLKKIAPIIFMSSNCYTFTDRENYVKELMKYIPIDSYGYCLNNKSWPDDFPKDHLNNLDDTAILNFVARYKFAIAIENGVCEDYVTEKFWRPIKLGVVPLYLGSPLIKDWFPNNKSAILIEDYKTPKELSEYLIDLLENDSLYEEYLEHKIKERITNANLLKEIEMRSYQTDVLKTSLEFECFLCKQLHENRSKGSINVVTKNHYNCSKPTSALTREPIENELPFWKLSKKNAEQVYERVKTNN